MEAQVRSCGSTMEVRRLRVMETEATMGTGNADAPLIAAGEDRLQMEEAVTPTVPGSDVLLAPLFHGLGDEHQEPHLRALPDGDVGSAVAGRSPVDDDGAHRGGQPVVVLNGPALRRTPSWPASQSEDPSREMRVRLDQEFMQGVARQSRELGGPVMDAPTNSEAAVNPFWSPDVKRSAVVNQAIPESGLARPSGLPETEPEGDGCQMATMSPDQAVERLRLKVLREAEELFLSEVRRMKGAEDGGSYHSASSGEARKKGLVGEQKRTSAGQAGGALPADVRHGNLPGGDYASHGGAQHAAGRGREGLLGGLLGGERGANSHGGVLPAGNQGREGLFGGVLGGDHGANHGGASRSVGAGGTLGVDLKDRCHLLLMVFRGWERLRHPLDWWEHL